VEELYAPFGGEKRFKERFKQIKAEAEMISKLGLDPLELADKYFDEVLEEVLKAFGGDVEKLRSCLLKVRKWARSRGS